MDRRVYVPVYRPEQGRLRTRCFLAKVTTQQQVFRLQQTLERLRLAQHAHGLQEVRRTVRPVRSQQTPSPSSLRLAAAFTSPGAPVVLYQLSSSYPRLTSYRYPGGY